MWKAGTQLQHLTELQLAREVHGMEPIMLKKSQSFCNSWDKDSWHIMVGHGIWRRSVQTHLQVEFVDIR